MPTNLPKQVAIIVAGFQQSVESSLSDWLNMSSPAECQAGEEELHRLGRGLADEIFEAIVTGRITDVEFEAQVYVSAKGALKLSHGGHRETTFRLLGGREVRVNSLYMKPDRRGRPGRKRKHRGKSGSGLYPVLAALGISFGATPALANEVCWHMTAHDSVRGARAALDRRDIDLGQEGVLKLWGRVANRAVSQRDTWVEEVLASPTLDGGVLRGKRVAVGFDGGRTKIRTPPRGRRSQKTGHHKSKPQWREPKELVIYVVDDKGKRVQDFRVVLDGTMRNADATFRLGAAYLKALCAHEAECLAILGDGADWIWNRVDELADRVGIERKRVVQILDFYHAAEKLYEIADLQPKSRFKKWHRTQWLNNAKSLLKGGDIEALLDHIETLAVGHSRKEVRSLANYFDQHKERMRYDQFIAARLPIGSGAIESAIRRVVNLRMKGNAKYWCYDNAEGMLLMRSFLKAGRFDDLLHWSYATAIPWKKNSALENSKNSLLGCDLANLVLVQTEVSAAA